MAIYEQNLEQLFENNFDCYADKKAAMSKAKFIDIVSNILTERKSSQSSSNNAKEYKNS